MNKVNDLEFLKKNRSKNKVSINLKSNKFILNDNNFEFFNSNIQVNNIKKQSNIKIKKHYSYKNKININFFFEFWLYHFLYFIVWGPFIFIFLFLLKKGKAKYYIHNLLIFDLSILNFINIFYWAMTVFNIYLIVIDEFEIYEIYNWFIVISLRIVMISMKYSLYDEEEMLYFRNNYVKKKDLYESCLIYGWKNKDYVLIKKEFKNSLKRNQINQSNFLINFMFDLSIDEIKKFKLKSTDIKVYKIHDKKYKYVKLFKIFIFILNKYKKNNKKNLLIIIWLIYIIWKTGYSVYNLIIANKKINESNKTIYYIRYFLLFVSTAFYRTHLLSFYSIVLYDIKLLINLSNGLIELLQIEKNKDKSKLLPAVNICDSISIQNLVLLKLIIFDFGGKFFKRSKFIMVYILIYIILILILFHFSHIFKEYTSLKFLQSLFFNDIISISLLFFVILILASILNFKFIEDKDQLHNTQNFITNLNIFKNTYENNKQKNEVYKIENNNVNEFNFIYLNCLNYWKNIYKDDFNEAFEKYIEEEIYFLEKMINQLNYYQHRKSYKILGIVLNWELVQLVIFGLLPLMINYMLNNYIFAKK